MKKSIKTHLFFIAILLVGLGLILLMEWLGIGQLILGILIGLFLPYLFRKQGDITCFGNIHIFDKGSSVCHCGGIDKEGNRFSIPTDGWPRPNER